MTGLMLRYSKTSPYARKVRIVAYELGLGDTLELIPTDTWNLPDDLLRENPLGKIPSLKTAEGIVLYDSPVICEYLASLKTTGELFPKAGERRWNALRLQALGDGIMDASVDRFSERNFRSVEQQSQSWLDRLRASVTRSIDYIESVSGNGLDELTIGSIAVASALGYLDLRFNDDNWRTDRPGLSRWFEQFSRRPSYVMTMPHMQL